MPAGDSPKPFAAPSYSGHATTRGVRLVLSVSGIFALTFAVPNAFGVFLSSIAADTGHGLGAVAVIPALNAGVQLGSSAIAASMVLNMGARRTMVFGALLMVLGLIGAATADHLWQIALFFGVLGGFGGACLFVPGLSLVGGTPGRRTGLSLGFISAAGAVGAALAGAGGQALTDHLGWRGAFTVIAAVQAVGLFIAIAHLPGPRSEPEPDTTERPPSDREFKLLYGFALIGSFGYIVPFVHLVSAAEARGITVTTAVAALTGLNVANAAGRLCLGALADRLGARNTMMGSTALAGLATLLLALLPGVPTLWITAIGFGFFGGAFTALPAALVAECCPDRNYAQTLGRLLTAYAAGALLGAPAVGQLTEATGGYQAGLVLTAMTLTVSALVLGFVGSPPVGRAQPAQRTGSAPNAQRRTLSSVSSADDVVTAGSKPRIPEPPCPTERSE